MNNEFDGVMRSHSDAELIKILDGPPEDYQPLALESAKKEFKRRNLSENQIHNAKQVIHEKKQIDESKAKQPLRMIWKVLAMMFPGLILFMFAGIYKSEGYERKSNELVKWTLYSFFFYMGLTILLIILNWLDRIL